MKEQIGVYSTYHVDGTVCGRERSLARFHYTFHVEQCVVELRDELKLVGVENVSFVSLEARSFNMYVTGKVDRRVPTTNSSSDQFPK